MVKKILSLPALLVLTGFTPTERTQRDLLESRLRAAMVRLSSLEQRLLEMRRGIQELSDRSGIVHAVANGRLTLQSATPLPTSDQSAASTLYFTPDGGNKIALYTGTRWVVHTFSQISLTLSGLTSDTNYDVFLYFASGTLSLELTAWSTDTARATALVLQDGVYVRSGAATRRYLGTIRTTSTTTTEDSSVKRYVWNYYNRYTRELYIRDTTNSWTASTWQQANSSTSNQVSYVVGINEALVQARSRVMGETNTSYAGVGLSSTTVNSAQLSGSNVTNGRAYPAYAIYLGYPGIGYRYLVWLENGDGATIYGDNGTTLIRNGLVATIEG